jgi:hypothetical protein
MGAPADGWTTAFVRRSDAVPEKAAVADTGLIVGRFCPPTSATAIHQPAVAGRSLVVFVTATARWCPASCVPSGSLRCIDVTVVEVRHDLETDRRRGPWERWIALFRHRPLTRASVYSPSEAYGAEIARRLGARAVDVDRSDRGADLGVDDQSRATP